MKDKYIENIKKLSNISFNKVCKELKINYQNVYYKTTSEQNMKKAHDEYIRRLKEALNEIEN